MFSQSYAVKNGDYYSGRRNLFGFTEGKDFVKVIKDQGLALVITYDVARMYFAVIKMREESDP